MNLRLIDNRGCTVPGRLLLALCLLSAGCTMQAPEPDPPEPEPAAEPVMPEIAEPEAPPEPPAVEPETRAALIGLPEYPVFFNNDGCDAFSYPESRPVSPRDFLDLRTSPLTNTQVDAIAYCTISSGFGLFTHPTRAGQFLTNNPPHSGRINIAPRLVEMGRGPLGLVLDFARDNELLCYWSMRVNDTHDAASANNPDYPLLPDLKLEFPEWLVSGPNHRPPHGSWSSMDFSVPEVRDLAVEYVREVCEQYDVDGIDLDFFRHLCFFPSVAFGGRAFESEREQMTTMMRRIREVTRKAGERRGRPIPLLVRVPDHPEYAAAVGLDIVRWMEEDLVDILVGSGYFRLRPWSALAELGKGSEVLMFAGLSETRVDGEHSRFRRGSTESYRARAMAAWQAGLDGLYIFNVYNAGAPFLSDIGDPGTLLPLEKHYFTTVRNGRPERYLEDGDEMLERSYLTPEDPAALRPGAPVNVEFEIGDDLKQAIDQGLEPEPGCHLLMYNGPRPEARLNGVRLEENGREGPWWDYHIPPSLLRPGLNRLRIVSRAEEHSPVMLRYDGAALPQNPWISPRSNASQIIETRNGALLIADRGTEPGDYSYFRYMWNLDPDDIGRVEARVKVVSGLNSILLSNGRHSDRLQLFPDHIKHFNSGEIHEMDTTRRFHVYRVEIEDPNIRIYVDNELVIESDQFNRRAAPGNNNNVGFGAANSPGLGEALWDEVRVHTTGVQLSDAVITVNYR